MAQETGTRAPARVRSNEMRRCLDDCQTCEQVCLETLSYCIEKGGDHARADHLALLMDCARICETSSDFLARGSTRHKPICAACAEICKACEESCEQWPADVQMRTCADACRKAAEACRLMAA